MYEKTVAGLHKIYVATGTGAFASVYNQLSANAQTEITNLITNTGAPQYESHDPVDPHRQNVRRILVDGYLRYPEGNLLIATDPVTTTDIETLQLDEIYPVPVVNWIYSTYFKVAANEKVVVRIFFS